MRSLSEVKEIWVKPYLERLKKLNEKAETGKKAEVTEDMLRKRKKQEAQLSRGDEKAEKLRKAKERFQRRKDLRKKMNDKKYG